MGRLAIASHNRRAIVFTESARNHYVQGVNAVGFLEKFFAGAFGLILVYLLINPQNRDGVNSIFRGFADFNVKTFGVLQGRGGVI